ncbi:DoxX family protein [Nostoc sp. PCC 7107]|uniref:DoxX family protein n=1 Tax=Nostoc sp. PCC 7107 TaxID=317936 RepID=UPI00029EFE7C|nr:DoxX family protein [Nostoc sp. PCC 7107]AFY45321.1 hypothetical protein Nos7107_4802 [Nostoc sp. PCC 7107]
MNRRKELFRIVLAISIIIVGITHFAIPAPYVKIMPPQLPYPLGLVYLSGFYEILGGIGLLIPPVSQAAAWGLVLLFIAVFPANINMAINHIKIETIPYSDSPIFQAIRLPLQAVLIAWAWWYTRPSDKEIQASLVPKSLIPKVLEW